MRIKDTPPRERPEKILIVDDEPLNCELVRGILSPLGYDLQAATSGKAAISLAKADPPDVILLDINMPGLNGYEVAKILKADSTTREIPIAIMTAICGTEERIKALAAGADDFLFKPIEITELRTRVQSLVRVKAYQDHMRTYQRDLERLVDLRTRDLQMAIRKIKTSAQDTINRLVAASEYKDQDTGGHIARVGLYAGVIARQLGLESALIADIVLAAPMHDIGKIGIPDGIILKPGPLTPEEWNTMRQHTLIGAQILKGSEIEVIRMAESIALTHHERWDGSGYPNGLHGEAIPLAGRIVAVADVLDALCSKRPYRDAAIYPIEKVYAIIQDGSGTQFDPVVVDALMATQNEILAIKKSHSDVEAGG
ncbi:MAG: HD domain-containing phosphohydrolase [bacterium]